MTLSTVDPLIANAISSEELLQSETIRLIPSENYVSKAVRAAVGSVLMNKYSEGQAGKRYYQGNSNIDTIETEVKRRALSLFGLDPTEWHVNVQPVTGSIANLAAYNTLISPGDKIMGMYLFDGGHLSHGWEYQGKKVSFTSKIYSPVHYHVDPITQVFDYEKIEALAAKEKPSILISGGTAYPREIDHAKMGNIARKVGCYYMADIAHEAGLVAGGANQSPFPHADVVTMTTRKTLRGPIGAMVFVRIKHKDDLDRSIFPGLQGGPQNHSIAGIGVALHEASQPSFKKYAEQVVSNARLLAKLMQEAGFHVISGGTDKHLVLIDLSEKGITGSQGATALEKAGIIVNKNTVPNDPAKPWNPSGIRLGTPAITTIGMAESEVRLIADWINQVLKDPDNPELKASIRKTSSALARKFHSAWSTAVN